MPFRLTIRNRVLVSKMSIFEGTIFVFRKICQIFPNFYNSVDSCEKTKITFAKTLNGSWKNLTEKSTNFLDFFNVAPRIFRRKNENIDFFKVASKDF